MSRVALVHDWLTGLRGGERVLEQLCLLYPDADIFTLVHVPGSAGPMGSANGRLRNLQMAKFAHGYALLANG